MLSKANKEFFEENGYRIVEKGGQIYIKHRSNRLLIGILGALCLPAVFLVSISVPLYISIPLVGLVIGLIIKFGYFAHGKTDIQIPLKGSRLVVKRGRHEMINIHYDTIDEISWNSAFVSEYASPFKETSTEYRHTITLRLKKPDLIPIFHFQGDYEEPNASFMEIYQWLKEQITTGKKATL